MLPRTLPEEITLTLKGSGEDSSVSALVPMQRDLLSSGKKKKVDIPFKETLDLTNEFALDQFEWGRLCAETAFTAFAICSKVYSPCVGLYAYQRFCIDHLIYLPTGDVEKKINLHHFNAHLTNTCEFYQVVVVTNADYQGEFQAIKYILDFVPTLKESTRSIEDQVDSYLNRMDEVALLHQLGKKGLITRRKKIDKNAETVMRKREITVVEEIGIQVVAFE